MMRSNSKLPFWLTGEKVSSVKWPVRSVFTLPGGAKVALLGGVILKPALPAPVPGMGRGCAWEATPAISEDAVWLNVCVVVKRSRQEGSRGWLRG